VEVTAISALSPTPALPPHHLPIQAPPIIGRETALDGLQQRLADPEVRLVTIIGPGGIGKTRLALALAERQLQPQPLATQPATSFADLEPGYATCADERADATLQAPSRWTGRPRLLTATSAPSGVEVV
jgi:hypothetical protein